MGVDATLFAKNAKKGFYFDRYWKLRTYEEISPKYLELMERLDNKEKQEFTQDEMNFIITTNLEIFKKSKSDTYWLKCLQIFINKLCPNDVYFCATDHEYKANFDYINDDGYVKIEEDLISWDTFEFDEGVN